jgi:hypothetical protein
LNVLGVTRRLFRFCTAKVNKRKVAAPRFDRGTSGLWALRAIPAAPCCSTTIIATVLLFVSQKLVINNGPSSHSGSATVYFQLPTAMATSEAALKLEIARLTGIFLLHSCCCLHLYNVPGAINRHRSGEGPTRPPYTTSRTSYVNPSYKPPSSKASGYQASSATSTDSANPSATVRPPSGPGPSRTQPRDVTINGVVFESSKRSLVRKDSACMHSSTLPFVQLSLLVKPSVKPPSSGSRPRVMSQFSRNKSEVGPRTRTYKPKGPSGRRSKFDNTHRAYQLVQFQSVPLPHTEHRDRSQGTHGRKKYVDKPCPRFTTTGALSSSLTSLPPNLFPVPFNHNHLL